MSTIHLLLIELKRAITIKNILIWLSIIFILPLISFVSLIDKYVFFKPVEVFQEIFGSFIPLIFPILIIIIYLTTFLQEKKNNFISYTRPRAPLSIYIFSKAIINAFLTGVIVFFMIFLSFVFVVYIEPHLMIIHYTSLGYGKNYNHVTFDQFLLYGKLTYGLVYSSWISINAVAYTTIAFLLMILMRNSVIALSAPFLFYHVFNFITGVFGVARFSPISTLFPFNIEMQPIWTALIPFFFLLFVLFILCFIAVRNKEDWMI